ncbi:MAG: HIT domain-containing protein [Candidatus Babeliales bacterium]
MDKLWAPWRIKYIRNKKQLKCIFCSAKEGRRDYIVFKTKLSVCLLNIYPYNNGHVMVSPFRHVKDFSGLKKEELLDLMSSLNRAKKLLEKVLQPNGFNIGANIGSAAGAGIAGHLHIHIVPRWKGDTNFMPILAKTKVVSQSLSELLKLLKNAESGTD